MLNVLLSLKSIGTVKLISKYVNIRQHFDLNLCQFMPSLYTLVFSQGLLTLQDLAELSSLAV